MIPNFNAKNRQFPGKLDNMHTNGFLSLDVTSIKAIESHFNDQFSIVTDHFIRCTTLKVPSVYPQYYLTHPMYAVAFNQTASECPSRNRSAS